MNDIHGHCVCGAVNIIIKEYGNFVYTCHCDKCRRMNSGQVLSVDPGLKENVVFDPNHFIIKMLLDSGYKNLLFMNSQEYRQMEAEEDKTAIHLPAAWMFMGADTQNLAKT